MRIARIALTAAVLCLTSLAVVASTALVEYPEGYRNWTHLKSMVIHPDHSLADPFEGIHHVYANKKAQAGLSRGSYKTGSAFVFDLLEYAESNGAGTEGARKFIGVMQYDERRFPDTGGWGFEAFAGDSQTERVVSDGGTSCFGCHMAVKDSDYVFSSFRQ